MSVGRRAGGLGCARAPRVGPVRRGSPRLGPWVAGAGANRSAAGRAGYAGPANRLRNHFSPAPIAFSRPSGRKPVTATASKATAPTGIDHRSVTAIVVPTSVTAEMLMPMASASLSPGSRSCDRRAQPKPGSNRQAAATKPKRSMPIRPVAARSMTPITTATASANASFFVNQLHLC
jgi:hypothetical protein